MSTSTKFFYGVLLPVLGLAVFEVLIIEAARGKGEAAGFASMQIVFVSFVAFPAMMLFNYWTLFVRWNRRPMLFLGGLLFPLIVGAAMAVLIHGTRSGQNAAAIVLGPFTRLFALSIDRPGFGVSLLLAWITAMFSLFIAARARAARPRG
jgi:hypothetical protein